MAIKTRAIGQKITAAAGGKPIHPVTAVPGGQSKSLSADERDRLLEDAKNAVELIENGLNVAKPLFEEYSDAVESLGPVKTYFGG